LTDYQQGPGRAHVSRRQALRTGGVLGLAAASVALVGASAQAASPPADSPDPTGPFGRAVAVDTRAHQLRRAATTAPKQAAAGITTSNRLPPSRATIDNTPLARREPIWTVEG
jgi:hypothetical protein